LQDKRLPDRVRELAREPLLLYLLAAMHRDGEFKLEMFEGAAGAKARDLIYSRTIDWVLTKQRPEWLNKDITAFQTESLRRILAEAGLCVVQSGGECAPIKMIEDRLKGDDAAKALLEEARSRLNGDPLRNALAAFYLQPGREGSGSVEFAHKSFGEFLCAGRIKDSLADWAQPGIRRQEFYIPTEQMDWEIYDLLGFGGLTPEIVEYITAYLDICSDLFDPEKIVRLFKRLEHFYLRWCDGEFIDAPPENLPQKKMRLLKEQLPNREKPLGQRQVDVCTGLNILILILEINRHIQNKDSLADKVVFYPFGNPDALKVDSYWGTLIQIINYSYSMWATIFSDLVGPFLKGANLSGSWLYSANLRGVDLSYANLSNSHLKGANFHGANLTGANFSRASLEDISWDENTKWEGVQGLKTAVNVPEALKRQLGLE